MCPSSTAPALQTEGCTPLSERPSPPYQGGWTIKLEYCIFLFCSFFLAFSLCPIHSPAEDSDIMSRLAMRHDSKQMCACQRYLLRYVHGRASLSGCRRSTVKSSPKTDRQARYSSTRRYAQRVAAIDRNRDGSTKRYTEAGARIGLDSFCSLYDCDFSFGNNRTSLILLPGR